MEINEGSTLDPQGVYGMAHDFLFPDSLFASLLFFPPFPSSVDNE